MNQNEYIKKSLELHLFFDRIMKEHSFFLEAAFTEKNSNLKKVSRDFQKSFGSILNEVINLANGNVSKEFFKAGEMFTQNTLNAESVTSNLSGIEIDMDITKKELSLVSGEISLNEQLLRQVQILNKKTISLVENLIEFKQDILNSVLSCKMYTMNYPLLISHIMNEAKMYYTLLSKLETRSYLNVSELQEEEIFWNTIMKEHAEFIRGLLDPSEEELIIMADKFADEYNHILNKYQNNVHDLTVTSLQETQKFRDFKITGEEGILNCKVKSIIIPLLADHVVREANHFIRILEEK